MERRRRHRILAAAVLGVMLACGGDERRSAQSAAPTDTTAERPTIPPGPGPWIAEIRAGIQHLPAQVGSDPVAARRRAVELYATRQEAIERAWGPGGSAAPDSTLAAAVLAAESTFHELLTLLNRSASPDSAEVADAVAALDARLLEVERAAARP